MVKVKKRKPRFKRINTVKLLLQARDIDIVKQVAKHRLLDSEQIKALVSGSNKGIARRLTLLYHNDYLDRPRAQIRPYEEGSRPMIYALGNKGADLVAQELDAPRTKVDWTSKNRELQPLFIDHSLLVSNFMTTLHLAAKRNHLTLIEADQILGQMPKTKRNRATPLALKTKTMTIIPDGLFGLHSPTHPKPAYFFLEADRATMPIIRKNLNRTSIYKKLLGYWTAYKEKTISKTFNIKTARVLTITKTQDRIDNMIKANKQVDDRKKGTRLFLFTQIENIDPAYPDKLLEKIWQNGRNQEWISLID